MAYSINSNISGQNYLLPSLEWLIAFLGLLTLYIPTFWDLSKGLWATDQQAHGPIVLGIALWLIWRNRILIRITPVKPYPQIGWPIFGFGLLLYIVGRSQGILFFEVGSIIWLIAGLVLIFKGPQTLRLIGFGLFFMCFMIPLPGPFVDALTLPMKTAVSYVVEQILYGMGYPISRNGVILTIGQYQLLVADACAGLHTLFTLEAMGLLYLNLIRHHSILRNLILGILIVPISFLSNVIRVSVLVLITFYFGDSAGQGFLHGFAGMVLFLTALLLIIGIDSVIRLSLLYIKNSKKELLDV
ncbi:exosortase B [Ampullimonas aquatilis]|uniref:exosortase B n=1 Tax=Ampullimonas aquatilis TaxID=1341549 RepID=UPI003C72A1E8